MKRIGLYYASWLIVVVLSISAVADASRRQHCNRVHPREINLLENLIQETDYLTSMNFTPGPNEHSPAVLLDGSRGICVENDNYTFQRHLHEYSCIRKELVIRACIKFDSIADGPIFFLHANNMTVLSLEVDASEGGSIKVSFVHNGGMRAVSFPYTFTDPTSWHNVSVIFNGRLIGLYVNCNKVADQVIMEPEYCLPEGLLLNIGDNPQHTETFQGSLQDLIISFKERAIAKQCPKAHTDCRYSAVYQAINNSVSALMDDHARLTQEVEVLRENVTMYQSMVGVLACYRNGRQYDYQTFFYSDKQICFCSEGGIIMCTDLDDIKPDEPEESTGAPNHDPCKVREGVKVTNVPVNHTHDVRNEKEGTCTSRLCTLEWFGGDNYLSEFSDAKYYHCNESFRDCTKFAEWTTVELEAARCCGYCTTCEMQNTCGKNTNCVEDGITFTCECKDGYILENGECIDINECKHGRHPVVGHYCPLDAECVNTDGSFDCQCPENHKFVDRKGHNSICRDINECVEVENACPPDFVCTNTKGSHTCTCPTGFIQDGNTCIPHCDPPCRPEGQCIRSCKGETCNNICQCPGGLRGAQCERDVNECNTTTHGCSADATCINFHGGYFCQCNDGYRGNGRTCVDINECLEGTAQCPSFSRCVNTMGSYICECPGGDCKGGCFFQKTAYPLYGIRYKGQKNCTECTCQDADSDGNRWSCLPVQCDCSQQPIGPCCSHCNKDSCRVDGEEYDHTEEFIHPSDPCKTCRCKHGTPECEDHRLTFNCPSELLKRSKNGCDSCAVPKCTIENDGTEHEINNSCSVCTCKNSEWTCRSRVQSCPPISCEGNTIMMGCCPVCEGLSDSRPRRILPLVSLVPASSNEEEDQC